MSDQTQKLTEEQRKEGKEICNKFRAQILDDYKAFLEGDEVSILSAQHFNRKLVKFARRHGVELDVSEADHFRLLALDTMKGGIEAHIDDLIEAEQLADKFGELKVLVDEGTARGDETAVRTTKSPAMDVALVTLKDNATYLQTLNSMIEQTEEMVQLLKDSLLRKLDEMETLKDVICTDIDRREKEERTVIAEGNKGRRRSSLSALERTLRRSVEQANTLNSTTTATLNDTSTSFLHGDTTNHDQSL